MRRRFITACCVLAVGTATAQELPPAARAALQQAGVPASSLALAALPLHGDGAPWLVRAMQPMQPGSTMKLVTSIVALDRLGPNLRGFTELRSAAPLAAGALQGDLVLRGGADPELGIAQFWALLVELRAAGVERIAGDLVVDRTLFRPARMDVGVPPFDDQPEFPYNVIPDALQLAGNLLPVQIESDDAGVRVAVVPPLNGVTIATRMALTDTACKDWDDDWKPAAVQAAGNPVVITLQGGFPKRCRQRAELQLIDRLALAEALFRTLWQGLGGRWDGRAREGAAPAGTRVLARRESRPWGEVLRTMNKESDNPLTRMLFLQLGVARMAAEPQASTAELAAREVRAWLAEHRIADAGLVLDNGSGLSRSERITPLALASMLKAAAAGPHAADLAMSLPVAGVDGTMRRRLAGTPAAGWARLKTGTLRNVTALAGYVTDAQGRPWAISMMINDDKAAAARPALDAIVEQVVRTGLPLPPRVVGPLGEGP